MERQSATSLQSSSWLMIRLQQQDMHLCSVYSTVLARILQSRIQRYLCRLHRVQQQVFSVVSAVLLTSLLMLRTYISSTVRFPAVVTAVSSADSLVTLLLRVVLQRVRLQEVMLIPVVSSDVQQVTCLLRTATLTYILLLVRILVLTSDMVVSSDSWRLSVVQTLHVTTLL